MEKSVLKTVTTLFLSRRANEDVNSATRFKVAVSGEVKKLSREF